MYELDDFEATAHRLLAQYRQPMDDFLAEQLAEVRGAGRALAMLKAGRHELAASLLELGRALIAPRAETSPAILA